jgi:hypothetical protein
MNQTEKSKPRRTKCTHLVNIKQKIGKKFNFNTDPPDIKDPLSPKLKVIKYSEPNQRRRGVCGSTLVQDTRENGGRRKRVVFRVTS